MKNQQIVILNQNCNIVEFINGSTHLLKDCLITIDGDQMRVLNNIVMPTVYGRHGDYSFEEYYVVNKENNKMITYEIRKYHDQPADVYVVGNMVFDKTDADKNYYMPENPKRSIKCKTILPKGFKDNPVEPMSMDMLYNYK